MGVKSKKLPLVVIVGRPNTGKSTLFNRFLHKRRAITDPTPGVTRDPIEETVTVGGLCVRLMDTGGFKLDRTIGSPEAVLDELVVAKTLAAIEKADLILLLLDAGKITGEDEEFIALLRPHWARVIAAANKTEGGRLEEEAWNCLRFGFNELVLVSAEHGDHFPELCTLIASKLGFKPAETDDSIESDESANSKNFDENPAQPIRIAVMGRPNTGKSTLTNRLTNAELSIVSDYAGTTRDVIEGEFSYKGHDFCILDTAGIRRKSRVTENVEYYSVNRAIKTLDMADIMFLLIDAKDIADGTKGLAEQDKKIAALASERGRGVIFVLNKWDTQEQDKAFFRKTVERIRIMFGHMDYAPVIAISAKDGDGIKALLNTAIEVSAQLKRKVETGALNSALADWVAAYPPPVGRSAGFKLRYMVQKSVNPMSFLVFASKPDSVSQSYVSYIKNKVRSSLGFDKIPVLVEVRAARKKWEDR